MRFVLISLMVVLAGCAGPAQSPAPTTETAPELIDAAAAYAAGEESANLDMLGIWENTGEEADAWEDLVAIDSGSTVFIMRRAAEGFEMTEVAQITGTGPKDVKFSDDGQWLFIGNDEQASALGDTATGRAGGFYTYHIGDPANPDQTDFLPVGPTRGPHMVFYHQQTDGTELVFGANGDISINTFDRESGMLSEASRYQPNYVTDVDRSPDVVDAYYQVYAHDMFVMEDDGRTLMYVANWDAGLRIVDVTDPHNPVELGTWNEWPEGHSGNLHTVATEWIDDRRITVGSVEVGFAVVGGKPYALDQEKSIVYIWDTTDLNNVVLLGQWENPEGLSAGQAETGEVRSTHNFQIEGGFVYLAHYALGTFVLDITTHENQAEPKIAAYNEVGNVWDVIISDGVVVTSGGNGVAGLSFPLLEAGTFSRA